MASESMLYENNTTLIVASFQQNLNQLNLLISQIKHSLHGSAYCGINIYYASLDEEAKHKLRVTNFSDQEMVVLLDLSRHELLEAILCCLFLYELALEAGQFRHIRTAQRLGHEG